MTKYNRITGKVFGGNATATGDDPEIGQFGSAKDGSFVGTTDVATIQSLPAWSKGWIEAVSPEDNFPPLPEITGAMKVLSHQQCYLLQQGVPEWDNVTIYYKNNFSSKNGKIYISQSDTNQGNDPETDKVNWKEFSQDKANKDLDNLTEAGEKHFLNKSQITNCLLEVPQRIKLELNDGVLTLKAGSQVIVPDGTGVFDEVKITEDKTATKTGGNGQYLVMLPNKGTTTWFDIINVNQCVSGTIDPLGGSSWHIWYDTSNNQIKWYGSDSTVFERADVSLPIALVTIANNTISSIDQVFNGMGYIGSTVWVDKGVKGLIPNGRNEDGTLKNIEFITNKVLAQSYNQNFTSEFVFQVRDNAITVVAHSNYFEQDEEPTGVSGWTVWLNTKENISYLRNFSDSSSLWTPQYFCNDVARIKINAGVITSLTTPKPFRAVDYNDFEESLATKADVTTPSIQAPYIKVTYKKGDSWYRIWSDGWCEQGGIYQSSSYTQREFQVNLLKKFTNTSYTLTYSSCLTDSHTPDFETKFYSKTTRSFKCYLDSTGGSQVYPTYTNWKVCGYLARGEY